MSIANSRLTRPDAVDASCRLPVLKAVVCGLAWLLAGLALLLGASILQHQPAWGGCEYFGYGKMAAAARVALIYGFAVPTGLAVGLWVLFRSAGTNVRTGLAVAAGSVIWNLGVISGVAGIIAGEGTGLRGFEFPAYTGGILLAGYLLMGVATLVSYGIGSKAGLRFPQLMVLAAMVWFPWLLTTAQIMLVWMPVRGVLTALTAAWYEQSLMWGVLVPLTLAGLWQLRDESKEIGLPRPVLATFGYWSLLVVAGWLGASTLVGGPVPAWVASTGVVAGVLLIIPVVLIGLNLFGGTGRVGGSLAILSGLSFLAAGVATALTSLRCANSILHFTGFPMALTELLLLGFVTLGLLSALYVVLPRLVGFAWPRTELVVGHVGLSAVGLGLTVLPLLLGGWIQGHRLDSTSWGINAINAGLINCLRIRSLGLLVLFGAQVVFLAHWAMLCIRHFPVVKQFTLGLIQEEILTARATVRSAK